MSGILNYGTITPEQKKAIFEKFMLFLMEKRYDFSIKNGQGRIDYVELECPALEMTLDLEFDSTLSQSNLMCHAKEHHFMVNDFNQIIDEIKKSESIGSVDVSSPKKM